MSDGPPQLSFRPAFPWTFLCNATVYHRAVSWGRKPAAVDSLRLRRPRGTGQLCADHWGGGKHQQSASISTGINAGTGCSRVNRGGNQLQWAVWSCRFYAGRGGLGELGSSAETAYSPMPFWGGGGGSCDNESLSSRPRPGMLSRLGGACNS